MVARQPLSSRSQSSKAPTRLAGPFNRRKKGLGQSEDGNRI
jgi:hypothetical protein